MNFLGNILWLLFGGLEIALLYYVAGVLMCCTIVGIPFGLQLFKFGTYTLWPFGHRFVDESAQAGCVSTVMNILWIVLGWWEIALCHLVVAVVLCLTIVGIPFAKIHFRIALASAFPFGKKIR